jgi:predicted O-methyltransferase YrrM
MNDEILLTPPSSIAAIEARAASLDFTMASETRTGALLKVLAASKPGGRLLELGTGTGVGTAWLLEGMDAAASLVSVDSSLVFQAVAQDVLGHDLRLTLVLENGADFLRRQKPASFDLIFADAIPGKYENLDQALSLVKPGGYYVVDDLLPQPNWPEGHEAKVPVLIEQLRSDSRFYLVPLNWASGIVVAVRKSE